LKLSVYQFNLVTMGESPTIGENILQEVSE
jgi:hypothetical protein